MEHDGRLDQTRLSGRRPTTVAATALVSVAGPWLLAGLALTAWFALAGEATFNTILGAAAIAGFPTMLAAASTPGSFTRQRVDPRIVVGDVLGLGGGSIANAYVIALIVEGIVIAACLRRLPRRIAHAPAVGAGSSARLRPRLGPRTVEKVRIRSHQIPRGASQRRRARSPDEFIAKIGVAAEQADESKGWLQLLVASGLARIEDVGCESSIANRQWNSRADSFDQTEVFLTRPRWTQSSR